MKKRIIALMLCLTLCTCTTTVWAQEANVSTEDLVQEESLIATEVSESTVVQESASEDMLEETISTDDTMLEEDVSGDEEMEEVIQEQEEEEEDIRDESVDVTKETEEQSIVQEEISTYAVERAAGTYFKLNGIKTSLSKDEKTVTIIPDFKTDWTSGYEFTYMVYDLEDDAWYTLKTTTDTSYEWNPTEPGVYWIHVIAKVPDGTSTAVTIGYTVTNQVMITGLSVEKEKSDMWNASVYLEGSVDNKLGQELTYEYLVYDGAYWEVLDSLDKLESVEFIPKDSITYTICFQILDRKGEVLGQYFTLYTAKEAVLEMGEIAVDITGDKHLQLDVECETNDKYAEYKWMYYDIAANEWWIIQDWSENKGIEWNVEKYGAYWIYVECRTTNGISDSVSIGQMVEMLYINIESLEVTEKQNSNILELNAAVKTNDEYAEYRWMYYELETQQWGVIQDWSEKAEVEWEPLKSGSYWIHVEGRGVTDEVTSKTIGYIVKSPTIDLKNIQVSMDGKVRNLQVEVETNGKNTQYRWMYYDLEAKEWGLIQDWSEEKKAVWKPQKSGTYWIHVEAKEDGGATDQFTIGYVVEDFNLSLDNIIVDVIDDKKFELQLEVTTDAPTVEYRWLYYDLEAEEWGLIQDWSEKTTATWNVNKFGTYWIHAEGRLSSGKVVQKTVGYVVEEFYVTLKELDVYTEDWASYYIKQNVETNDPNITYSYQIYDIVKNEWHMIGTEESVCWQPENSGGYWIHAVVTGSDGQQYIKTIGYTVVFKLFDEHAKEVMHNIIYAVETGGQIYGNAKYDTFCPAFNLTAKETAITIGAGGWFATNAQELLIEIRKEDPETFAELDTAGISEDLDTCDWSIYGSDGNGNRTIERGSEKALCIQKLISTEAGIKVQDRLVDEQMESYVNKAQKLGVQDLKARMFCANIHHLGGYSAMRRVIENCKSDGLPLTMENIWESMRAHTTDLNGNTVGANKYKTRHQKVMEWLNKYM